MIKVNHGTGELNKNKEESTQVVKHMKVTHHQNQNSHGTDK